MAILHSTGTHYGSKKRLVESIAESDGVLVTTYSGIRLYKDELLREKWDYVILDEGHKIRNPDAEITLTCKQVSPSWVHLGDPLPFLCACCHRGCLHGLT